MSALIARHRQRGQALPIFALAAFFIVGTVALTVDFGFLANQHRNLQVFSDEAATAGAYKLGPNPGPSERTAARKAAFIYLRDNLGVSVTMANVAADCGDFGSNIGTAGTPSCLLRNTTFKISIWSPAESIPAGQDLALSRTVSVRVSESVTTALAGIFSFSQIPVGAYSAAQYGPGQPNFALYSDGCVNVVSNKMETIAGNVYINECGLSPSGTAAFCTYNEGPSTNPRLGASAGDAVYGPYANLPTTVTSLQTVAGCRVPAAPAGAEFATGNIAKSPYAESPPAYGPPPNIPTGITAATPNHTCHNGTRTAAGGDPGCYDPGAYTTIGMASPIANNLNPGVYHIYGDTSNSCYTSATDINCAAVVFGGNTMNANYNDVVHQCWANPQVPAAGNFTAPCPDGFIDDPTSASIADPQCSPGCPALKLTPPTFTLSASALGGTLDPAGTGTTYYVRITAINAFGESLSNEVSVPVLSPTNTGRITATITVPSAGATGYKVYGPSLAASTELFNPAPLQVGPPPNFVLPSVPLAGAPFPVFDSSYCKGFCNVPTRVGDDHGVTFVLEGKAGVCLGVVNDGIHCDDTDDNPVVMLSPYCAGTFLPNASVCPASAAGTNDGTFVFYGPTQASIRLGGKGTGVTMALTGVLDTPRAFLDIDEGRFHVVPGQVVVHNVDIDSVNLLDPLVYFGLGPPPPISVRLIQ